MLRLVVQAQHQRAGGGVQGGGIGLGDEAVHRRIDPAPVGPHLVQRRATEWPALRPRVARAQRLVIPIEQPRPAQIGRPVAAFVRLQHPGLEKPDGVRQMPFGRAGIGHRLQLLAAWRGCACRLSGGGVGIRHRLQLLVLRAQVRRRCLAQRAHAAPGQLVGLAVDGAAQRRWLGTDGRCRDWGACGHAGQRWRSQQRGGRKCDIGHRQQGASAGAVLRVGPVSLSH